MKRRWPALLSLSPPRPREAQGVDGAAVFAKACASCHAEGQTSAPTPAALRALPAESILNSLTNGRMQVQGATLSATERTAVALFAAGRGARDAIATTAATENKCTASPPMANAATSPGWNGWGNGAANTRFASNAGITAADLPRLKLKWAFGYSGVSAARAQPTIAGGRLFVASENGEVHALDPKTGCTHWTFKAGAGVRTGLSVGPYKTASASGQAVYFGDTRATAYAVDAQTGAMLWTRKVDDHPSAALTGSPTVYGGRVYVPVQGLNEEGQGGRGGYQCCTFRGSLVALDANTGARGVEDLHRGRGEAAREEPAGRPDVGTGRRRHLVRADRGRKARRGVRGHGQRLRRPAAADDRRRGGDGPADRTRALGAADDRRRPVDDGLPGAEPRPTRPARPRSAPTTTSRRRRPSRP